jgi:hypothetical protein
VIVAMVVMLNPATRASGSEAAASAVTVDPGRAGSEPGVVPPDPRREWTAEVEWRPTGRDTRFRALARRPDGGAAVAVAESPQLEWPPSDARSVEALTEAADALATTLEASGWKPLRPGGAWYAKRFRWDPVTADSPAGELEGKPTGRFWRSTGVATTTVRPPR